MTTAAVVVAAGRGERLSASADGPPKALIEVAGRPLIDLALTALRAVPTIHQAIVVHPPGTEAAFRSAVGDATLVPGGDTRGRSVRAGLAALADEVDVVAIHDAARPLVPPRVVAEVLRAVRGDVIAAAPGLPVVDTLKRVGDHGDVLATVPRRGVWAVHTPQVVRRDVLEAALAVDGTDDVSDDLGLVEAALATGTVAGRVRLVRGDPRDLKITYPEDLYLAAAILRGSSP